MLLFYMVGLHLDTIIQGQQTKGALCSIISFPREWRPQVCKLDFLSDFHNLQNKLLSKENGFFFNFLSSQITIKQVAFCMMKV